MQKKEFGRYSTNDLRGLSELTRTLEPELADLRRKMASEPDKVEEYFTPPFYWAAFYETPFLDLVAVQVELLGLAPQFSAIAKQPDPQATILRELPNLEPGSDINNLKYILGIMMAIQGNLRSMGFHSKSLEELTREVAQGDDKAFFDAVLIDRTILACPPFADRIAWAEYQGDDRFFKTLAKRLSKGIPTKKVKAYVPLRVCLYALELEGCLESLSELRAYELFCKELKLYPEESEGDASRSLKRFIQRWRTERAT